MNHLDTHSANSNYPPMSQSEWERAPWNEESLPEIEIPVTVSITLSKTVTIAVDDYERTSTFEEEDGIKEYSVDTSCCDLKSAVKVQIDLPQDKFPDWTVDEMEVVEE